MEQTCLCCGYRTLYTVSIFDICEICYWEDDPSSWDSPERVTGGPNGPDSLHQAQKNFVEFGASAEDMLNLVRKPTEKDVRDDKWTIYANAYKRNRVDGGLE